MKHIGSMTWECPIDIPPLEAYALSIAVRLYACREKKNDREGGANYLLIGQRYMHSPTALTNEHIAATGGIWAYLRYMIRRSKLSSVEEVDDFVAQDESGPEGWINSHPAQVEAAEEFLGTLVGKFVCYG
jgi:hypothetical protein